MTGASPAPATLRCARHAAVETRLRCGRCDTPICPRCLVHTPVGARCPACARPTRLPVFTVSWAVFLRAAAAGSAAAVALGLIWSILPFGGLLALLPAAGAGFALGEAISLAANRKRATPLQGLAAALALAMYLLAQVGPVFLAGSASPGLAPLAAAALLRTLVSPLLWLVVLVCVFLAVGRLR